MTEDSDQDICPACGRKGTKESREADAYTCFNNSCDVWFYGRENRSGGDSSTTEDSEEAELRSKEQPKNADETGVEPPKPDLFHYEIKTTTTNKVFWYPVYDKTPPAPNEDTRKEGEFWTGQTIRKTIQEMKEEIGDKPSSFDRLNRNAWKERRKTLEELEEVFNK